MLDTIQEQLEAPFAGLAATARHQLVVEWNDTQARWTSPFLLHEGLETQAARNPDALAVAAGEQRLTYRELEARANQLARHLQSLGVGPEVRVGLCVERDAEMVVALFGILKAGGAYVALDPAYPRQRLALMLEDSGAEVVLAQRRTLESLPFLASLVVLDDLAESLARLDPAPIPQRVLPENLAYVVYTSGSTGRPKGVALTHRSAAALVRWGLGAFAPDELAGVLVSTSLCFDLSVFEVFVPLSAGGAVIVAADALELPSLPPDPPVTLLNTVPSAGAELVRAGGIPDSVRVANFCGEALPATVVEGIHRTTRARRVVNLYGPSEDTVYSTVCCVEAGSSPPPIGRPIPGSQAYVLGQDGDPAALGEEGELLLGGAGLARGYLGRPDLTAERFVPDPFGDEPGGRLYRTGDRVRHRADGELLFLGRADHQIKLRGYRIELGEIDATLLRHPAVREAVTMARRDAAGGLRLQSYVALDEPVPGAADLRSFLGRTLPEPMIPSVFFRLEALPRTLNGKIDRKGLPEPADVLPEIAGDGSRGALEDVLAMLWEEALELESVGPHDDLFALGARATQVAWVLARVRDLLGVTMTARAVAAMPTVAGLAATLEAALLDIPPSPGERVGEAGEGGQGGEDLPLSFAQQRLWFLDRLRPGEPTYHELVVLELRGSLSVAALAAALNEVMRRHEALRTRFGERDGEPFQEACPPSAILLPAVDLAALSESAQERERLVRREVRCPFDLARPPLLRALLLRESEGHTFALTVHHIGYDGRSRMVLAEELEALYSAARLGAPSPLAVPGLQPSAFAAREQRTWRGWPAERLAPLLRSLRAADPLELPGDRPRSAEPSSAGAMLRFTVPFAVVARLRALAQQEGSSLFRLLLALFALLLARMAGRNGGIVGTSAAVRPPGFDGTIGFFVNLLALPLDLSGRPALRRLLAQVGETVKSAVAARDLPYQKLAALRPDGSDLFRVLFQLLPMRPFRLADLDVRWKRTDTGTAKFDLETTLTDAGEDLEGFCEYRSELYDAATIAGFAARFQALLEAVAVNPEGCLEDHPLLREAERREVTEVRRSRKERRDAEAALQLASPAEELIAQIWAEVLGLESVGRRDNFFHLGGHSLLASRVLSRVRETLGPQLPVRALFQAPTVETLAEAVLAAEKGEANTAPPFVADPGPGPHPLSFAQEALWLVSRMQPDGPLYNVPLAYRLRGPLNRHALLGSIVELARRHQVLRSRLTEIGGELLQEEAVPDLAVPWIDLSALSAKEPEIERLLRDEAALRFDLSQGPLLRSRLLLGGDEDHVLQLTAHHTAFDGGSQAVLERQLSALYAGREIAESLQYSDYACWQRARLVAVEPLLAYWRAELEGAPAVLDLATDRPRPAARRAPCGYVRRPLPASLAAAVRSLARAEGATPVMIFLAAFQAQLHRATGQDDVLVGTPVSSRNRRELEDLIGLFVDTVVLRGRFGGEGSTFRELIARSRDTALAAFAHQDLPLARLVADLRLDRSLSHNPLFQVMFAFQSAPAEGLCLPGVVATRIDPGPATAMFDLTLTLEEREGELSAALEYDRDLFDGATAESLLSAYRMLLTGAVEAPERRLSEIALTPLPPSPPPAFGRPIPSPGEGGVIHGLVARQAERRPEAVALVMGGRAMRYGELDRESTRLAHRLRRLGAGPETIVGVQIVRSLELVVAMLAVWKAGAAYLPLDPTLPEARLAMLVEDSGARIVLRSLEIGPEEKASLPIVLPESLAYVLYTSGSTGGPKPVAVSHGSLAAHVQTAADFLELSERDRVLFFASPAFDVSLEEVLPALIRGATVVLRGEELWAPADFLDFVTREGITVADLPTAYWRQWVRESAKPASLRLVSAGGEAMPAEEARLWLRSPLAGARLLNAYGPTEAVITASVLEVDAVAASRPRAVSLGRPLAGRRAYVLDLYGQLQPMGVAGELCLAGSPLARGYLGRSDPTAERFVPDPWSVEPGGRLYRTGDLARVLPDGTLEYLGRLDRQLKIRGVRVEPAEIEAALLRQPEVKETAVDLRPGAAGELALVAWIVPRAGEISPEALRRSLLGTLPETMIPTAFVPLPALPLTPAGKVDRAALPAPEAQLVHDGTVLTPVEEVIAAIWMQALGLPRVGPNDSFVSLGGHSLLAVQILSRVRETFDVDLPVRSLFAAPTIRGLARAVVQRSEERASLPPLVRSPSGGLAPLSFPQQRLWFLDRLQPGRAIYNVPIALRLDGPLESRRLEQALGEMVRRHEALRTRFVERDGQPWQEILPSVSLLLPEVDLLALPPVLCDEELARLGRAEALRAFDLGQAPLLRSVLVGLEIESRALLLTLHHIVSDAWSDEILGRELSALYRGTSLPALPIQYSDYARWQRSWPEDFLTGQLEHWKKQLAGLPALELPADRPRPSMPTFRGDTVRFTVPAALTTALRDLARQRNATLFMALVASWQALLGRLAGQTDLAVGSPVANRGRSEVEGLVGFFVNLLALRGDLSGDPSFEEPLARLRRVALDAYAHQELPFERLVDELGLERDLSRQPLVQVMIALQDSLTVPLDLSGVATTPLDFAVAIAKFDLTLSLAGDGEDLAAVLEYSTDLFDRTTILRLARQFLNVLDQVTARPAACLSEMALLTALERQQMLREWNDTQATFPSQTLVHQFFEARADCEPDAVAAIWNTERLTYGELEARANRLANLLRRLDVVPGVSVGIWMERSLDMIVAVLAVLKAGGTYLPCDAAWPAERVEAILGAVGARVVLTRSALLAAVEDLQWRVSSLNHAVCMDLAESEPPVETLDPVAVRQLWDHVAERALDRVAAGGFVHSATGLPFSEAEVDEYRDRVLSLAEPWLGPGARVLEIGCGSGLILWELAKRSGRCVGLDPSPVTQERNREHAYDHVELLTGFAHEIAELFSADTFDLIVLASTVQFFPGRHYLERVVAAALSLLAPGGALLIADVPDARHRNDGKILSLDQDWFRDLASEVSILHRREGFENELRLRYDVILTGEGRSTRRKYLWTGWHIAHSPVDRLPKSAVPESIAYVIHTSGSTGRPKGIAVQHRAVANLIHWLNPAFGVGPQDRVLFVTSLAFDLSVWDVFGLLAAGGSIHVASEEDLRDPQELVRALCREPITIWDSAPAALMQLAPLFPSAPETESCLRLVMLSGDWIPVTLPDRARAAFPRARFVSLGGATEATVWSNRYPVRAVDPSWPSIPYGRPIANARYHVLDGGLERCPIGIPGDLYIGGDCLCVGYLGQPDLTAGAFLPDSFSAEPGGRLYRTGDRARVFGDGNLEFLGRADQQLKIRGYRIEPGEIEALLVRQPGIREAVVVAREDRPGDKRLVAYVAAVRVNVSDLLEAIRRSLPEYMIPSAFVILDALPVTANGKLDRGALPVPRWEGPSTEPVTTTATEERLLTLWREVLGLDRCGVHDSFFDLGGHSLLATQLVARLRESFGVEVPLRALFQNPTVAGLAALLDAGHGERPSGPPLRRIPRDGELPLSASQLRQWFLVQLDPGDPSYNLPLILQLEGALDRIALERALAEIVRRHEVLRTTFRSVAGRPVARIASHASIALGLVDLVDLPIVASESEAGRLRAKEADRSFDLARGPLLRVTLLRLGASHELWITLHHIVFDGWSMGVFLDELAALYAGMRLPALAIQYADYAAWQRDWLASPAAEAQAAYWRVRLSGVSPTLALPTDRARPGLAASRGALLPLAFPPSLGRDLRQYAAREGATLFMVVLAAWSAVLARYAAQKDFNVGTFVANRRHEALERLLGLFVNTLALPMDLSGDPDWRGLVARVRDSTLDAFEHQELPFERLLETLELERDLSRTPLFQVFFGVQSFAMPARQLSELTIRPLPTPEHDRVAGDLALWAWEEGEGVGGWLKYAVELFDRTTAERLASHLVTFLSAAVATPDARLSGLPLLRPEERHQLLHEWGTGEPADDDCPVHERIAVQARLWPQATAVEDGREVLSYADLLRRADSLAAELRRHGVGPESVVGVAAVRSAELIVSLLGILRAGAAYLPLDPALPPARRAQLLAESGARVVVDQRTLTILGEPSSLGAADLGNLAYTLYTSGSTGVPKGVGVEHGSLTRFVTTAIALYGLAPGDRVLQFASLSFDISVEEIFASLCAGATLVLRDEEMIASPAFFLACCQDLGITVLDLPTAYCHELASAVTAQTIPQSLRLVILAGEKAQPGPLQTWLAAAGNRLRLIDTYGPTEGTVVASASPVKMGEPLTIGRPIRGVQVWLLDADLRPVPAGVPGELFLGGGGLARGYLNRSDLTAERFVPSPFGDPGSRLYRTGDLARWLKSGEVEFLGRIDDQVKIRGFRIEPDEVAAVLSAHPMVEQAAVVAHGARLAAYAVPAGHSAVQASALRSYLKERLPSYMVPPDIVLLESLPRTPNGKVDRNALPAPDPSAEQRSAPCPVSTTEVLVASIWRQVLGVEEVGLYDDFFDLGGHSLLAPQVLAGVQETFQVDLPLRALFEASTVAQLATLVEGSLLAEVEELSEEEAAGLLFRP